MLWSQCIIHVFEYKVLFILKRSKLNDKMNAANVKKKEASVIFPRYFICDFLFDHSISREFHYTIDSPYKWTWMLDLLLLNGKVQFFVQISMLFNGFFYFKYFLLDAKSLFLFIHFIYSGVINYWRENIKRVYVQVLSLYYYYICARYKVYCSRRYIWVFWSITMM